MNYTLHYQRLIDRAQGRSKKGGVFEKHHILPKCLGGSDDKTNLVLLTPEAKAARMTKSWATRRARGTDKWPHNRI